LNAKRMEDSRGRGERATHNCHEKRAASTRHKKREWIESRPFHFWGCLAIEDPRRLEDASLSPRQGCASRIQWDEERDAQRRVELTPKRHFSFTLSHSILSVHKVQSPSSCMQVTSSYLLLLASLPSLLTLLDTHLFKSFFSISS
jgi:hypothetical protein